MTTELMTRATWEAEALPGRYEACEGACGTPYVVPEDRRLVITEMVAAGPAGSVVMVGYSDERPIDLVGSPLGAVELWKATLPEVAAANRYGVYLTVPEGKHIWAFASTDAWVMPTSGFELKP